jgi:hypothetical protein
MNNKYFSDKKIYGTNSFIMIAILKNNSHIIQSCTGTEKITAISDHTSKYIKNKPYKNVNYQPYYLRQKTCSLCNINNVVCVNSSIYDDLFEK